jgi:hypothetical protein
VEVSLEIVNRRTPSLLIFVMTTFLFLWPTAEVPGKTYPLPHVSPAMEKPEFWIDKVRNPTNEMIRPDRIRKMDDEIFQRSDLYLSRVKDLKEDWTREELLELLREDWQGFGKNSEIRFGRNGQTLNESFWKELEKNIYTEGIKERNRVLFGLIAKRTDIRVFPTAEPSLSSPSSGDFDRFQHSMISPGSLVAIYHTSKDENWVYLQASFIRGWVKRDAVAMESQKKTAVQYVEEKERLVITGDFVTLFRDSSFKEEAFGAQMGDSFPLSRLPHDNWVDCKAYVVRIPSREKDGRLIFQDAYISKRTDVHPGFLPYTQENVAKQAFKMLHQPYGWGEMFGGRDCSRFIMDIFATFGIVMPRNSMLQARVGIDLGPAEGKSIREKRAILEQAPPLATTLRLPGHIMLYLGKQKGRYYVIHSIWGFQNSGRSGANLEKVGAVVVSDLSLGEGGPSGSLLKRLTDIRFIGEERGSRKHPNSP